KLKYLAKWNRQRWEAAKVYNELMSDLTSRGIVLPDLATPDGHVFHLYVIQVDERDRVLQHLNKNGVQAGIHYPNPFHLQGGYRSLGYKLGDFPRTEKIAGRIFSLPIFPEITLEQIERVVKCLREGLN